MSVLSNGYLLALTASQGIAQVGVEFLLVGGGSHAVGKSSVPSPSAGGGGGGVLTNVSGETGTRGISALPTLVAETDSVTYAVIIGGSSSLSSFAGTNYSGSPTNFTYKSNGGDSIANSTANNYEPTRGGHSGSVDVNGTVTAGFTGSNRGDRGPSSFCWDQGNGCDSDCVTTYFGAGAGATQDANQRDGGDGAQSSITGSSIYYAGGSYGTRQCNISPGSHGQGQSTYGGGGVSYGNGNDGVLILRYSNEVDVINPGGGLTFSTVVSGTNRITTITAGSGNITFSN